MYPRKLTRYRSRKPHERATKNLELVHCDLACSINTLGMVDDDIEKNDTLKTTEKFLADSSSFAVVKRLCTDNVKNFKSSKFLVLMAKNEIKQEFSAPYSPHQNGTPRGRRGLSSTWLPAG